MREKQNTSLCFLAAPFRQLPSAVRAAIEKGVRGAGYELVSVEGLAAGATVQESVMAAIASADCVIAWQPERSSYVFFELGLAQAMGKPVLIVARERDLSETSFPFTEFNLLTYSEEDLNFLASRIEASLGELRVLPRLQRTPLSAQSSPLFYVDWDSLEPREVENLCRELLSQMGFRKLDWGKGSREIDLVAELPKKDPDGFEYRELWLISLGLRAPVDMLLEMVSHDAEYLFHRLSRYSEEFEEAAIRDFDSNVTLLLIVVGKPSYQEEIEMLRERIERRRFKGRRGPFSLRVRFWDQEYVTSLVHRFPGIGYKYFSPEGRIRSKTRKSYEELYNENAEYVTRLARQNKALQDEKNRRISAERDAVWKDISFSAAHKIGNPIFAIETDLNPLALRVDQGRTAEAQEVIDNIRSAIEKAKAIVEQFKSLTRAQEIHLAPTLIRPILEDACKSASKQGIECLLDCPPDVCVNGDRERLSECFDELVMNACQWFDKEQKQIWIEVLSPAPSPLPDFLETSLTFVLIRVRDSGAGIDPKEKTRIFDAFFTKRPHGTGLGLALVRRIIEGHKGGIIEIGLPGKGADFEIFLPMPDPAAPRETKKRKAPRAKPVPPKED